MPVQPVTDSIDVEAIPHIAFYCHGEMLEASSQFPSFPDAKPLQRLVQVRRGVLGQLALG